MPKVKDLTDQRFGRLTVLRQGPRKGVAMRISWVCMCNCGKETTVLGNKLRGGYTQSKSNS